MACERQVWKHKVRFFLKIIRLEVNGKQFSIIKKEIGTEALNCVLINIHDKAGADVEHKYIQSLEARFNVYRKIISNISKE